MPVKLTEEQVKSLWATLKKRHGVKVKDKSKSWVMRTIGKLMHKLGIMSTKDFAGYWTTVGHTIYKPTGEKIGNLEHIEKLAHEFTHVNQDIRVKYLLSKKRLTLLETEAFCATVEMHHFLTGQLYPVAYLVNKLEAYGCTEAQLDYAAAEFKTCRRMAARGLYVNRVVREIIAEIRKF